MKAKDYVHELYENNITMKQIIDNYDEEIDDTIKEDIETEFNNNFVMTSNENGVARFENMLEIKPTSGETLETRKEVVLNRLTSHLPFTQRFLEERLDAIIGENQWILDIDYSNYEISISITVPGDLWYSELVSLLNKIMPCNMLWTINVFNVTWGNVKENFLTWRDVKAYTWREILLGKWMS